MIAAALITGVEIKPSNILPTEGTLQILITDSPLTVECSHPHQTLNFTSLVVTIGSVQVHRSGALNLTSEWIPVANAPKSIDILQLKNVTRLLGTTSVPEGTITLVRVNVTSPVATTSEGKSVSLVLSSGKLEVQPGSSVEVRSGMTTSVVIDFLPHVVCEGTGTLRLTPVLSATARGPE